MGSGELHKVDPFHVILKRIVLTGYPAKINRRKAVVNMMFFNPNDVRYFKPIELSTKLGLRVKFSLFLSQISNFCEFFFQNYATFFFAKISIFATFFPQLRYFFFRKNFNFCDFFLVKFRNFLRNFFSLLSYK